MAGIYIHIPFCKQACTYCNFHFSTSLSQKAPLLDAIHKEIFLVANDQAVRPEINTIYFGGGTPSLLSVEEISALISLLRKEFAITPGAEISFEANPDDVNPAALSQWRHVGINRISVGLQSFDEQELMWMNRAHNARDSERSVDDILAAGFTNFSIDLIYGSPLLSNEQFINNLAIVIGKVVPHVSAYALTVEPKTILADMIQKKTSLAIDESRQAEQFDILVSTLTTAGYEQYEISNFAKPGFRSQHNSSYWRGERYFGFGPSAHSFDGNSTRRWNVANNALYINAITNGTIPFEEEVLTVVQQVNEMIMISLRTSEGLDLAKMAARFGSDFADNTLQHAQKYVGTGQLSYINGKLTMTGAGKFFADGIAADLFF